MKPWIVLLFSVAVVHSQRVITFQRIPLTNSPTCEDQCASNYSQKENNGLGSCESGCRLLNLIDTVEVPFGENRDDENILKKCHESCIESFENDDIEPCKAGCNYQLPIARQRRTSLNSALDDVFPNFSNIKIGFPSQSEDTDGISNIFNSMPNFNDMFDTMRKHMNDVMTSFTNDDIGELTNGNNGKITVIKSGPGYQEKKTYNFGPDGVKTEVETTKSNDKSLKNDMMSNMNPFEKFFKDDLVDIFQPKNSETKEIEENSIETEKIIDDEPEFKFEPKVFDLEEPHLPEEGLRTRIVFPIRHMQLICSQNSDDIRWSDWVSCLHTRMGLPRWLTAATISLGIVFIIWLCLVIPHNVPKQRVKMTKAREAAGHLEKDGLNLVMAHPVKLDLPPSYEDIANLHVAVPVVGTDEAAPLPEKKKPVGDEDKNETV